MGIPVYKGQPTAVSAPWAAIRYPAKYGGIVIFCFLRDVTVLLIASYFVFKPAHVLAEAFTLEEGVFWEVAGVCFFVAVILEDVVAGLVEVVLVLMVCSVVFFALDTGVVIFF